MEVTAAVHNHHISPPRLQILLQYFLKESFCGEGILMGEKKIRRHNTWKEFCLAFPFIPVYSKPRDCIDTIPTRLGPMRLGKITHLQTALPGQTLALHLEVSCAV